MRDDDGNSGKAQGDRGKRKRIAKPEVERRREAEFLANADAQHTTVHEHRGSMLGRRGKDLSYPLVVQFVAVHCGKKANATEALLGNGARETRRDVARRWVEHEEADES